MDSTDLSPNPIVFFASFLIFLTYICNKLNQNRAKAPEENNFHEYYSLQEHYVPHAPHVQTTIAQELPRIFEEQPRKAHPRNGFMNHHEEKDLVHNYVPYRPVVRPAQDESLSQEDGWTAREPEFGLTDVSAIHPLSRTKGPSVDNSLLDYPIFEPRGGEQGYVEFQQEMSIEEANIGGVESKKKTTTKLVQRRREVIYQESSESDNDGRSLSQQGNNRNNNNMRNGVNVRKDESIGNRKRQIEFEESYQSMNDLYSRDTKGFTDYEPGITKKSQQHEIRASVPNGKTTKVTEEPLVKVKEVFDLPSRNSSKRKALDKDSKNSGSLKTTKHSEGATTDEDASKKKVGGKTLERGRSAVQESDSRKELLRKQSPLDLSYLGEYGTNQSLKKYVAKKTVQEQAFRGTGYASDETSKKTLADLAAPKIVQQSTAAGSNVGLFAKPAESAAAGSGGSGLFKNDGAAAGSGTAGQSSTTSSLFGNLNKPAAAADSGSQSTAASGTENKSSGLFGPAGGATENKSSGLFSNIADKKAEAATAQKPADNAQKPADTSKSLFGDSGASSGSSSLFGPGVTQKTQATTTPAPAATNTNPTSSLFGPSTTENKGLPRVGASEDLTKTAETQSQPKAGGLFANLNSAPSQQQQQQPAAANTGSGLGLGLGSLVNQSEKKELISSLFGNAQSQAAPEQKPNPPQTQAPAEEKKAGGLFSTLTQAPSSLLGGKTENKPPAQPTSSLFSQAGSQFSQSTSQPAATSEPKKDEQPKSSMFGGLTNTSSGLFGGSGNQSKPEPPKEPAPQQPNIQQGSAESPPPKGLLASFGMGANQSPQQGGGLAGLFGGNKPSGGSINPNVTSNNQNAPAKTSLFGGGLSKPEGSSTGSGLFGSNNNNQSQNQGQGQGQQQSGGSGLAMFNQNQNNSSPQKPAGESSGGTSSLFGQNNNASAQGGNKSSGLLGMLGNNANTGSSNSGGMFSNVQAGSSGSSLFGNNNNNTNNNNQNNANQGGGQGVGGLNALLFGNKK